MVTTVLDSVAYCYLLLPYLPFYSIPHLRSHTRSSAHPGIACLRTRISAYRTRSNANPGVSCLRPSILTTRYAYLPYPSPYFATLPSRRLQLLASCENSSRVSCSCLSAAPWRAPFVSRIACAYFQYWLQSDPMRHGCLPYPYVGHILLHSLCLPHYLHPGYLPCPVH